MRDVLELPGPRACPSYCLLLSVLPESHSRNTCQPNTPLRPPSAFHLPLKEQDRFEVFTLNDIPLDRRSECNDCMAVSMNASFAKGNVHSCIVKCQNLLPNRMSEIVKIFIVVGVYARIVRCAFFKLRMRPIRTGATNRS